MNGDEPWFEPNRYGYGAGRPIAWQGWALLGGYSAIALLCGLLLAWDPAIGGPAAIILLMISTLALTIVSKARTRGGWRWRWGDED